MMRGFLESVAHLLGWRVPDITMGVELADDGHSVTYDHPIGLEQDDDASYSEECEEEAHDL